MFKLPGLKALQAQFEFNGHTMTHVLLYKNLPAAKLLTYQLGLGRMVLVALECRDIHWALDLMRRECLHGLAGTCPVEYDPYYGGDDNPPLEQPRAYDAYHEMGRYLWADTTPHGLGLDLSPDLLSAVDSLLVSKAQDRYTEQEGIQLMTRDDDEGEFRPMTKTEVMRYSRQEESRVIADCLFTVDFNADMARLRQLVAERGSFQEILDLIGPEATDDEMPF